MRYVLSYMCAFLLFSCKTYNEENRKDFDKEIKTYLLKNKLNYLRTESGLYYQIISPGIGDAILPTDEVSFTYKGKLLNGTPFDLNHKNDPITFKVSKLILAWQEAMFYIKNGGKINLIVPPQLGYGDSDIDKIPPNSILCFEMEVRDVK
jgi:FKBP-type peptidyl-prolyl cis-trans isomerase FkpA